jgi:hypothetical protein
MLRNFLTNIKVGVLIAAIVCPDILPAAPIIDYTDKNFILKNYEKFFQEFQKKLCTRETENKFWELARRYQDNGIFIPFLPDDSLDTMTIRRNLPVLREKIRWIEETIDRLEKWNDNQSALVSVLDTEVFMKKAVDFKKMFFEETNPKEKSRLRRRSARHFVRLRQKIVTMFGHFFFLKTFNHPIDHYSYREEYDLFKKRTDVPGKRKANDVYFLRKIYEDGAQNPEGGKSDMYLRTVINSLANAISKRHDFIPEEVRYDLEFLTSALRDHHKRGRNYHLARMKEWLARENREYGFYQLLLEDKVAAKEGLISGKEYVKKRYLALQEFKDFVQRNQQKVYEYWIDKKEIYQALYVIDTILMNEVGGIDGQDALERMDVTQVVINRTKIRYYSTISEDDDLMPYLKGISDLQSFKWLNTLFKTSEFSFTYFFIPATIKVFCPDNSAYAKNLSKQNLEIALELLKHPREDFGAVRYFSRASMLGRINIAPLWSDFNPYPERPGKAFENQAEVKKLLTEGSPVFLYHFTDPLGEAYKVLKLKDNFYVADLAFDKIYKYRNPHHFRFFTKR